MCQPVQIIEREYGMRTLHAVLVALVTQNGAIIVQICLRYFKRRPLMYFSARVDRNEPERPIESESCILVYLHILFQVYKGAERLANVYRKCASLYV